MTHSIDSDFAHVYSPGDPGKPTLLLLHGTGGDENDLVPLGRHLLPGATILSPRGQVLENGMPRFFRRFAEGVLDVEDLRMRAEGLANWVRAQVTARGAPNRVVAVGFSNGANIATGVMFAHADALAGAVLFRPMVPYEPDAPPKLPGVPVLICAGRSDPMVDAKQIERLAAVLRSGGADVTLAWQNGGHGLVQADIDTAASFIASRFGEAH
jgi:predicted esterase